MRRSSQEVVRREAAARIEAARRTAARLEAERRVAVGQERLLSTQRGPRNRRRSIKSPLVRNQLAQRLQDRRPNARNPHDRSRHRKRPHAARPKKRRRQDGKQGVEPSGVSSMRKPPSVKQPARIPARQLPPLVEHRTSSQAMGARRPQCRTCPVRGGMGTEDSTSTHSSKRCANWRTASHASDGDGAIRSDGSVESVTFVVSSGVAQVDDAIRRIVKSQSLPGVPAALAREYDVIEIRRTWHFDDGRPVAV